MELTQSERDRVENERIQKATLERVALLGLPDTTRKQVLFSDPHFVYVYVVVQVADLPPALANLLVREASTAPTTASAVIEEQRRKKERDEEEFRKRQEMYKKKQEADLKRQEEQLKKEFMEQRLREKGLLTKKEGAPQGP